MYEVIGFNYSYTEEGGSFSLELKDYKEALSVIFSMIHEGHSFVELYSDNELFYSYDDLYKLYYNLDKIVFQ